MRSTSRTLELIEDLNRDKERKKNHPKQDGLPITDYYKNPGDEHPTYVTYDENKSLFIFNGLYFETAEKINEFWYTGDKNLVFGKFIEDSEDESYAEILTEVCRIKNIEELAEYYITFEDDSIVVREATSDGDEAFRIDIEAFNRDSNLQYEVLIAPPSPIQSALENIEEGSPFAEKDESLESSSCKPSF